MNKEAVVLSNTAALFSGLIESDLPSVFLPYLVFLIDKKAYNTLETEAIQKDFQTTFNIDIPPLVIDNLIQEALNHGYVYKVLDIFQSNPLKISTRRFEDDCKSAISKFTLLKDKYREFVTTHKGINIFSNTEIEQAIQNIIERNIDDDEVDSNNVHNLLINDFLLYANTECREIVDCINTLSVANALWNLISNESVDEIFFKNSPKIYLDTRCVFRLIGLEGEYWKHVYEALAETIAENGGKLVVFSHVLDEINTIIKSARLVYNSESFDYSKASLVAKQFRKENYTDAKVDSILYKLNNISRESFGFSKETHDYSEDTNAFQVDYNL